MNAIDQKINFSKEMKALCNITNKKHFRDYFNNIHFTNNKAIATNGLVVVISDLSLNSNIPSEQLALLDGKKISGDNFKSILKETKVEINENYISAGNLNIPLEVEDWRQLPQCFDLIKQTKSMPIQGFDIVNNNRLIEHISYINKLFFDEFKITSHVRSDGDVIRLILENEHHTVLISVK